MRRTFFVLRLKILQGDFGKTLKDSWTYLSASIALKGLSIIGIPILTRLLTPEDYGILNIFGAYATIFSVLFTLNLETAVGRYYFEQKDDFKSFLGTSLFLPLLLIIFFQIFILFVLDQLASLLDLPVIAILFFIPLALLNLLKGIHLNYYRASKQPKKVRSLSLISGFIGFSLGILFVYLHDEKDRYEGKLWSGLVMVFISGGIILKRIIPEIKIKFKKIHVKYMLSYSLPLLPSYLGSFILAQFDRVMIGHYLGKEEAGQYSFAYNISLLLVFLTNSFSNSWTPKYYEYMNKRDYESHDRDVLKLLSLSLFAACGLILFSDMIGYILGSEAFHSSLHLIPIIILGQFVVGIIPIYKRHISFAKKTIYTSLIVVFVGILNIILNAIYIPIFGSAAGAYTTVISYAAFFLMVYVVVRFVLKVHVTPVLKIASRSAVIFLALIFYYVELVLFDLSILNGLLFKFLGFIICGFILFGSQGIYLMKQSSPDE